MTALTGEQVDRFIDEGFVHLRGVVPPDIVAAGRRVIWTDLGQDPDDPSSWTDPVARLLPSDLRPFKAAFDNPRLFAAFDQLVGAGRWLSRPDLGLFVVRFPHPSDPSDTAWHIDISFPPNTGEAEGFDFSRWRVNVFSRERALLMLFLFSDVGPDDAPTRVRVRSHLDVARLLQPSGRQGMMGTEASTLAARASATRPVVTATGDAGDVYLCHPFLVHAAQSIGGRTPRLLAQPPLAHREPFPLDRAEGTDVPVASAIRRGLRQTA